MESISAILLGASGLTGSNCLNLLLKDDHFREVKILVRKPLPISHEKLRQIQVDFDAMETYTDYITGDAIFCCLGTTIKKAKTQEAFRKVDYYYPLNIAKIARQNNVSQYLLISALGASKNSLFFYSRVKAQLEEELERLSFNSLHIFRPSLLLGERKEYRLGERISIEMSMYFSFLFKGPLAAYQPIEAQKVAGAMVEISKKDIIGIHRYSSADIARVALSFLP